MRGILYKPGFDSPTEYVLLTLRHDQTRPEACYYALSGGCEVKTTGAYTRLLSSSSMKFKKGVQTSAKSRA